MDLKEKVALVTGGSRGIGKAIVLKLAEKGCHIVINYISHEEDARNVLDRIKKMNVKGIFLKADISKFSEVENMVKSTINTFGRVDILVNNAAIVGAREEISNITEEVWDRVIDINLKGAFNCSKAVVPYMIKQKSGKIVNIASLGGKGGIAAPDYAASKGGIIGLTFSLAHQLAKYNILTNAIAPGTINTDMIKDSSDELKKRILETTPIGRFGRPDEIAHAVIFVLENDFILGEVIDINGGRYFN